MADEGAGHEGTGHDGDDDGVRRVLVAGVGNVFLADDGFGPEVVAALHKRPARQGVHVADFGIRGMDLAFRLLDGYDAAVLVDAAPRGGAPGTLYVIEAGAHEPADGEMPEAHGMDPVRVLALARQLASAAPLPRVLVLGCEPRVRMRGDEPDVVVELSEEVRTAVGDAVRLLTELTGELLRDPGAPLEDGGRADRTGRDDRADAGPGRVNPAATAGG